MTHIDLDTMAIESRARALRAAYVRDAIAGLFARLRGVRASGNATV
ncbi:RSP_7527 family protein [Jannaschia donghaensis]|uniref:Uncharacterized protein n=1 Tax=Jannaschia donghaensis TaxID=420998 RepID=A0A0M6YFQ0_9RHOB|nr:hypothetical protein [Jannaschia donghaensis]CTQ48754.1 hypothetical protein JDO7802_00759 [Jannaschia donghaensis]